MERLELARTIHHERMRSLEVELHRRRLLQPSDDAARTTSEGQAPATQPPATQPTATTQPAGSPSPRRSTSPVR